METLPISYRSVVGNALVCHLKDVVEEGQMITLPRSALSHDLISVQDILAHRRFRDPNTTQMHLDTDVERETHTDHVVAKIVMKHPGNMRRVAQRCIAGSRIDKDSILMTLHSVPFETDHDGDRRLAASAERVGKVVVFKRFARSAGPYCIARASGTLQDGPKRAPRRS